MGHGLVELIVFVIVCIPTCSVMQSYVKFGLYNIISTRAQKNYDEGSYINIAWANGIPICRCIAYTLLDPSRDFQHALVVTYEIQNIIRRPRCPHDIFKNNQFILYMHCARTRYHNSIKYIRSPNLTSIYVHLYQHFGIALYRIYPLL